MDNKDEVYAYHMFSLRKDPLTHAATRTNLEDIMLSEISLSQNDKYGSIHTKLLT